jgi:hypothetical protein
MDNKKITLIIFLAFAVICILSNPKEIEHKEAVKSKINQLFQKELANTENTNNQE